MADAAVSFVIERLGDLLISEAKFLYGVKGQVEDAQAKLKWMRSFLKDANACVRNGDERVRLWIAEIRESACALEDVIEIFVLKIDSQRKGWRVKNVLKRSVCISVEGFELHKVGSKIEKISTSLSNLTSALQTYGIRELTLKEGESSSSNYQQQRELRRAYAHVVEQDVVGLDKDIKVLVAALTKTRDPYRVVSICGMGGLGKTTLARKVYHHPHIRLHFDSFAWASISQQCEIRLVWEEILINLTSPTTEKRNEIKGMTNGELAEELYNVQKNRRCLVLLDDIWTTSTWDRLKAAFPEDETDSKIVLTTRHKMLALYVDNNNFLYEPRCLNENESWELFEKKTYFRKHVTKSKDHDEKMKKLGQEMLKHCGGLPLAIVVLSGLLTTNCTIHEWEMLRKNVKAYINKGKGHDQQENQGVSLILSLSYDELPYHLKPCFLHLAFSPGDREIQVKQLCYTWIAEGFISLDQQTQSSTVTYEDVAYNYLRELVDRNMIEVGRLGSTGKMRSCRIHDLMRDLSLLKAREENFLQFIDLRNEEGGATSSSSSATETNVVLPRDRGRRLAIYTNQLRNKSLPFINKGDHDTLRSLIFVNEGSEPLKEVCEPLFRHFRLLRVLRLEKYSWTIGPSWKLPGEIGKLIHLRLLSLRFSRVENIPSSIGNLRCLQSLDLRAAIDDLKVPNVFWRLEQLRHLYLPRRIFITSGEHLLLGNLSNLQTLYNVPTSYLNAKDFLRLTHLKKLVLVKTDDLGRIYHDNMGVTFDCLQSLSLVRFDDETHDHKENREVVLDIAPVISCYPQIYKLKVETPITKLPEDYQFSPNLMKLSLDDTRLEDDPMRTIGKLPNLRVLFFWHNSYIGNEMVCLKGSFPQLESLCFASINLKEWRIEEGALPSLRHLRIFRCRLLMILPDELRDVTTLMEVKIEKMPWEFKRRLQEGEDDFYKVRHVPSVVFFDTDSPETRLADII